ncbi:hypothetical protein DFJ74DRAFT_613332 [Hyaloraphidium curvatum]|nr:hypothetical protein DFJ74DRAFT_613332 [Hyaloraphidium curvatum]
MSAAQSNLARLTGIDVAGDFNSTAAEATKPSDAGPSEAAEQKKSRREPWEDETLTLRMLVTHPTAAGAIIGKAGGVISSVRDDCGVKAGVSKAIPGVVDRILTVSGHVDGVAKAYGIFAANLLENQNQLADQNGEAHTNTVTMRLLVGHSLMGSVIGKGGSKIKEIQEKSGARLVAGKDMLPQSTERTIDVTGSPSPQIPAAVKLILQAILDDLRRGGRERWMVVQGGLVLYQPGGRASLPGEGRTERRDSGGVSGGQAGNEGRRRSDYADRDRRAANEGQQSRSQGGKASEVDVDADEQVQTLTVPSDLVGCIIGRGGVQIAGIRRESQARITISREPVGSARERLFTISGTAAANTKALELIYKVLESEKGRREQEAQGAAEM